MTPLHAIVITGPGRPSRTIAELAGTPELARAVVVTAGTAETVWTAPRVVEQLYLGATLVLLFEDAAEASAFETRLTAARAKAARTRVHDAWAPKAQVRGAPRRARPVQILA